MSVFEPLAVLCAIAALVAVGAWARFVRRLDANGGNVARSSDALGQAAIATAVTLALGAAAILAPMVALLFV